MKKDTFSFCSSIKYKNKILFPHKKNEYAKIAVSLTVSKGQALRVFAKISTPPVGRVVFCQKTLTAAASLAE